MAELMLENEVSLYIGDRHINLGGGGSAEVPIVNHGTSDTTYEINPGVCHIWGEVASLNLTLATPADATVVNEYLFIFESGSTATNLSLPAGLLWDTNIDTTIPFIEADTTYEVSISNNIVRLGGAK